MALNFDANGYNSMFGNFAEFAQKSLKSGDENAIDRAQEIPVVTDLKLSQTIG